MEKDGSFLMGETEGETGLIVMGGAVLSKSLIQFLLMGRAVLPP